MFKKALATGVLALATLASSALGASAAGPVTNRGATIDAARPIAASITAAAWGDVSPDEAASLQFMREEEKLAHDVYMALGEEWGLTVFANIAASEQKHTDTIEYLLDRYDLDDPAAGKAAGEFANADLQALHDQLVAQGNRSVADALKVGAAIEEIDILDLQKRVTETDNADIQSVYNNLMAGSENHLRAFVSNLKMRTGETYAPQYLSQAAYDAIIDGSNGQGGRSGGGREGRGGRRGWGR